MMDKLIETIADSKISLIETSKLCTLNAVNGSTVSVTPQGTKEGRPYAMIEKIRIFEGTDYSSKIGSTVLVCFLDKSLSEGVLVGVIA
ncbi:MAG: hypothetical protein LC100_06195 [Chitinophagales bacterium]|nr:hypothetical protein [Chitinophagales bacterium]